MLRLGFLCVCLFFADTMRAQDTLFVSDAFTITGSGVRQGDVETTAVSSTELHGNSTWHLSADLSGLPRYHSGRPLLDALYNLSLEEFLVDVRDDGAFMAGEKWPGVWTRDVSYSIVLALASVDPAGSRRSLMAKVRNGMIVQDTGTGGSWPISTDRMTWALAAWEVYKVTGDREWLRSAYEIIRKSALADLAVVRDPSTGLFRGESSFLDWREQTYPRWMDPRDIYHSLNLGTNAVHFETYRILSRMASLLVEGEISVDVRNRYLGDARLFERVAGEIREGVNA